MATGAVLLPGRFALPRPASIQAKPFSLIIEQDCFV